MPERSEEKVEKIFRGLTALPSLPEAIQKLVELSEKDATPRQFAELISADQGLTAKVLKLVNSAFFGLTKPVASLPHAATLLGTKTLKSLVLSVSVMQLFKKGCAGFDPLLFWKHSVAVAVAANRLGARLLPDLEDDLYVAGLLHDTGTALLAQHLSDEYGFVLRLFRETERTLGEIEEEVFSVSHADVGSRLVARWQLPKRICDCIRYHELAPEKFSETIGDPETQKCVAVLRLAEREAHRQDFGFLDRFSGDPPVEARLLGEVSEDELQRIVGSLEAEVARVESLLAARGEKRLTETR